VKSEIIRQDLKHPLIKEIRGEGLLLAIELADPRYVRYAIRNSPSHGIILDYFLFCDSAFRIAPPLIISREEIKDACRKVISLLDDAMNNDTG